ncbi:MAG: helix-turn-helix domain-containing protein [Firmicutes bacterium]|nr:helix-turn-helix domain-containing protein [Bacillota bacterium]
MEENNLLNLKKEIGERIKESRKYANMTQSEVAKILRMTQQQYSRFENGVFELSYSDLIRICKLYKVSADYLLGLED